MSDDIQKARRMTIRLYALGERLGSPSSGELAQLLASNAFFQNDRASNLVKLALETSDTASSTAPLNKSFRLFFSARKEFTHPFQSRGDCLQSSIYDTLLCYMAFWGQVFEYYETMYYKPVDLPDGTTETSPASVPFEIGWQITCLFIRDTMLSAAARAAGLPSGYNRTLSWYFYPANATSELEEAKSLVLTVIAKIRKRGTVLVAAEGMIGHISFSNTIPLLHWVEDKLDKDWNNTEKLESLCVEYFESSSIRLNVNVNPVNNATAEATDEDALNNSFGPDSSFLDILDSTQTSELNPNSLLSLTGRAVALNIRPITPVILAATNCEWSGVDMGEFCREVAETCCWPEVVNTLTTSNQLGVSLLNMTGDVLVASSRTRRRSSLSAPSRLSLTPDQEAILPFPTPHEMPHLEPLMPKFGSHEVLGQIPIPELTPTPTRGSIVIPELTPTPRRTRDSDVTFFGGDVLDRSPLAPDTDHPLIQLQLESPVKLQKVLSRPSVVASSPLPTSSAVKTSVSLSQVVDAIVGSARRELSAKDWSLEAAMGDLLRKGKTLTGLYTHVSASIVEQPPSGDQNDQNNGRKRRRSSGAKRSDSLPKLPESALAEADKLIISFLDVVEKSSLKMLSGDQKSQLRSLTRILVLAHLWCEQDWANQDSLIMQAIAVAGDFMCFCNGISPFIPQTDLWAAGLRSEYTELHVGMFEVAIDLDFRDWFSLALFYNDFAYAILMGDTGLFNPNISQSAPVRRGPQKLVKPTMREALRQHCVMVCSELVNRWAFSSRSSFWSIYRTLDEDFCRRRRHGQSTNADMSNEIAKMNRFFKVCLVDAATFIIDLGDRVGASLLALHAAFDILRATVLMRPGLLMGRHLHQVAICSLVAASVFFSPLEARLDFNKVAQGVMLMQQSKDSEKLASRFLLRTVLLSMGFGESTFADCSGPLLVPGARLPESELSGTLQSFYEKCFVSEMRQVLFNMNQTKECPMDVAGLGPYPKGYPKHPSISPLAYMAICHGLVIGMQVAFGISNAEHAEVPKDKFAKAMEFISPLGVVPCLVPPLDAHTERSINKQDRYFRWIRGTTVWANNNGSYTVLNDDEE